MARRRLQMRGARAWLLVVALATPRLACEHIRSPTPSSNGEHMTLADWWRSVNEPRTEIRGPVVIVPAGVIGVALAPAEGGFEVTGLMPDLGGDRAGLRVGDVIERVDGEAIAGIEYGEVVLKIRGEPGTDVQIGLRRGGQRLELAVRRDEQPPP